jgi:arylsulfatase A-like enzyme
MRRAGSIASALLLLLLGGAAKKPSPPPNIVLLVIDTLRFDATSFADAGRDNTPFLASLASRGIVFTNAYSTHDFTPTSHFSIMTGLRDGLGTDADRPENGLAYQLTTNGYDTFAVAANNLIGAAQMPVHRAFRRFQQPGSIEGGTSVDVVADMTAIDMRLKMFQCTATPHARAVLYYSAERLLPLFLTQMRQAKAPYFGFVNLIDPHEPYVPDPAIYAPEASLPANFAGDVLNRPLGPELVDPTRIADKSRRQLIESQIRIAHSARLVSADLSPESLAVYRRRYDAAVRGVDRTLREFFAALEREKLLDNTIVIITSDHGESFGEKGFLTHMLNDQGDYEATHHVPLLVVLPKSYARPAMRVDKPVSIADIAPTIYDLAGIDWSPFAERHARYARSLTPMFAPPPAMRIGRVAPPDPAPQNLREAAIEREKAMRALGYLQ